MRITLFSVFLTAGIAMSGCKKPDGNTPATTNTTSAMVLTDFANVLAYPNYQDIQAKAGILNQSVQALITTPNGTNLAASQKAWRDVRIAWEQCESFLIGPVEDFNYDPVTDTWPLDKFSLDSLLATTNPLSVSNIDSLEFSLKGYHAIEYILFGVGGNKAPAQFTSRENLYLASLTQSLYNTTTALKNSWDPAGQNFIKEITNAGNGSTRYTTRKAALLTIAGAMADICNEVSSEKMNTPLVAKDSTLTESPYAHSSTIDFKNNIIGVRNAYMCTYGSKSGHSMHELVAAKNISLDNNIRAQLDVAINSFGQINSSFEIAIFTQQVQIHNTQNAINTLQSTLENDFINFINTNIKD